MMPMSVMMMKLLTSMKYKIIIEQLLLVFVSSVVCSTFDRIKYFPLRDSEKHLGSTSRTLFNSQILNLDL